MFKFTQIVLRNPKNVATLHGVLRFTNYSTAVPTAELRNALEASTLTDTTKTSKTIPTTANTFRSNNQIVSAAFASLQEIDKGHEIQTPFVDKRIEVAQSIDDLLSISADGAGISRRHALKVVSVLAEWSAENKVKLSEFEADPRFLKLCKVLARTNFQKIKPSRSEDLSTILTVTADDEAAKLVATITLPQMVKVMSTLAYKRRRSLMLLRSLAFHISRNNGNLDIKQCADLLYSVALLNFFDENLLQRITYNVSANLDNNTTKSAVVGSILTSLGLLKYKDAVLLDTLSEWMLKHQTICRPQDVFSFFLTLAVLNHKPANSEQLFKILPAQLTQDDASKCSVWVEFIWSLVLLNKASNEQISSVLSKGFINNISDSPRESSSKLKILNINAYATHLKGDYDGVLLLENSTIKSVSLPRSREKAEMITSILESLKNLVQLDSYLQCDVNTDMGFFIDAKCVFDKKCSPVAIDKQTNSEDQIRIAILAQDYHDMIKGRSEPTGVNVLISQLLEKQGYRVLRIPYTEFNPRDKLVNRVQYLETKIKSIVK